MMRPSWLHTTFLHGKKQRTSPQVRVDAHVTRSTTQTLALPVWYMLLRLRIAVLLSHTEVNDMDDWRRMSRRTREALHRSLFAVFVPGRPMRKLSGLISR